VVIGGEVQSIFGTSCSAPTFAGFGKLLFTPRPLCLFSIFILVVVTLLNAIRAENGLSTVGWLNPSLYNASISSLYNDVTSGSFE
jgi:hypothetical protein